MKRKANIFNHICSVENLQAAQRIARKGKGEQYGVKLFDLDPGGKIMELSDMLFYKEFTTSPYKVFKVYDPKERDVYGLPYYPDRIVQHGIMLQVERTFLDMFTADTYSCVPGKGIHGLHWNLIDALRDVPGTQYCLKLDVRKFYENVDHDILKGQLRRKFKDPDFFWLIDDIIDSAPGIPIGNLTSQFFANFYLTGLDHYIKEVLQVKNYFRYCDDMVITGPSKPYLHEILARIREYLMDRLKLTIKSNYQIFPVAARGIDVVGYVYFHDHVLLRKTIKKNFARAVAAGKGTQVIAAYKGLASHCNSNHLIKKLAA